MTTTNDNEEDSGVLLSRPEDESFENFKAWITEMFEHITGKPLTSDKDMSEQEWTNQHVEFWRKMHASEDETGE